MRELAHLTNAAARHDATRSQRVDIGFQKYQEHLVKTIERPNDPAGDAVTSRCVILLLGNFHQTND